MRLFLLFAGACVAACSQPTASNNDKQTQPKQTQKAAASPGKAAQPGIAPAPTTAPWLHGIKAATLLPAGTYAVAAVREAGQLVRLLRDTGASDTRRSALSAEIAAAVGVEVKDLDWITGIGLDATQPFGVAWPKGDVAVWFGTVKDRKRVIKAFKAIARRWAVSEQRWFTKKRGDVTVIRGKWSDHRLVIRDGLAFMIVGQYDSKRSALTVTRSIVKGKVGQSLAQLAAFQETAKAGPSGPDLAAFVNAAVAVPDAVAHLQAKQKRQRRRPVLNAKVLQETYRAFDAMLLSGALPTKARPFMQLHAHIKVKPDALKLLKPVKVDQWYRERVVSFATDPAELIRLGRLALEEDVSVAAVDAELKAVGLTRAQLAQHLDGQVHVGYGRTLFNRLVPRVTFAEAAVKGDIAAVFQKAKSQLAPKFVKGEALAVDLGNYHKTPITLRGSALTIGRRAAKTVMRDRPELSSAPFAAVKGAVARVSWVPRLPLSMSGILGTAGIGLDHQCMLGGLMASKRTSKINAKRCKLIDQRRKLISADIKQRFAFIRSLFKRFGAVSISLAKHGPDGLRGQGGWLANDSVMAWLTHAVKNWPLSGVRGPRADQFAKLNAQIKPLNAAWKRAERADRAAWGKGIKGLGGLGSHRLGEAFGAGGLGVRGTGIRGGGGSATGIGGMGTMGRGSGGIGGFGHGTRRSKRKQP